MKARAGLPTIPVSALRIGLYIHLDLGWMSHPFALSHFKIQSAEQIATIRSLGLATVRWNEALSDPAVEPAPASEPADTAAPAPADPAAGPPLALLPAEAPPSSQSVAQRAALDGDRAALALCEQQFNEAALALRAVHGQVIDTPDQARSAAQALTDALLDKMLGAGELCIRLLGEPAGDRQMAHALNVSILSLLMGRTFGWPEREMKDLGLGALLHDVGKLDLPERVRQRDEGFTAAETRYYEEHVARGVAQARRMGLSAGALLVIGQHHEMADKSGFPLKLGSERMTPAARIVAMVNRYDRLCNPSRPHLALTPHEAVSLMFAQYQSKFDTSILGAFVKMMGVYPPGSVVQLTDERLGIVVSVNSARPLKPRVQVYQPGATADDTLVLDLESLPGVGIRRSLKPQALPRAAMEALAPRTRVAYFFESMASQASDSTPGELAA